MEIVYRRARDVLRRIRDTASTRWKSAALVFAVCLAPSVLMFDTRAVFYVDWTNHLWLLGFCGEYFRQHASFLEVFHTEEICGIVTPLFYGSPFYPLAGMLSAVTGPALAQLIITICLFLLQFAHVFQTTRKVSGDRSLAWTVAVIITWAIYPLTNLYSRSAYTEFVAVTFLTCSMCCLISLLAHNGRSGSGCEAIACGLYYVLAAVTHPLTALFGALLLAVLAGAALPFHIHKWRLVGWCLFTGIACVMVLSPWLYALERFLDVLAINDPAANANSFRRFEELACFNLDFDSLWSRLSPFPVDLRSLFRGTTYVSTPYLDAQTSFPLLILSIFLLPGFFRSTSGDTKSRWLHTSLSIAALSVFLLSLTISIKPEWSAYFGGFFDRLQFPYRLVTYQTLALLCLVILLASPFGVNRFKSRYHRDLCLAFCLGIAMVALLAKLTHATLIRTLTLPAEFGFSGPREGLLKLPATFYGPRDYAVVKPYAAPAPGSWTSQKVRAFKVGTGSKFGMPKPMTVTVTQTTLLITNVLPFPWNHLYLNDQEVPAESVLIQAAPSKRFHDDSRLSVILPPGKHQIRYQFSPDPMWKILRYLSYTTLLVWFGLLALEIFRASRRKIAVIRTTTGLVQ